MRLTSSSAGRTALPPSHPQAASSDAVPAPASKRRKSRRSVMAREPPAIPPRDHGAQRRRIDDEHQHDVHDEEAGEDPHAPEMPVARRLKASEQPREPGKLCGLVDREAAQHGERADADDEGVGEFLERIVLALRRVVFAQPEVVLLHLDRAAQVARAEQQGPPLATRDQVGQIQQPSEDQRPRQREVPVESPREPTAQTHGVGERPVLKRIDIVGSVALAELRIGGVDLKPARDHAQHHHEREPVGQPHDPMMTPDLTRCRSRCDGGGRGSTHGGSILFAMRAATLIVLTLAACRSQNAAVADRAPVDSLDFADLSPADSADSILLTPRLVTGPTVIVFWLAGADTLSADDQAEALDELNYATEQVAPELSRNHIQLVPTNSDSVYVSLPNNKRRLILLSGVDYPFGYVLIEPGSAERILAGVYGDDEL